MTHDELLAKIENEASYQTLITTLCAVIELCIKDDYGKHSIMQTIEKGLSNG